MKILFITDAIGYRGKERRLTELLTHISGDSKIEIGLIVFGAIFHFDQILSANIKIYWVERKIKKDPAVFVKLLEIFKIFKPDIINSWGIMTSIYCIPLTLFSRVKIIDSHIADASPNDYTKFSKNWYLKKFLFLFANKVVANSFAGLTMYDVPHKKRVCIHNGYNFDRLTNCLNNLKVREHYGLLTKFIIGMVGYFCNDKDYKTYIDAARRIVEERDDVTFLAIGDGPNLSNMKKYAKDIDSKKFIFTGKLINIESIEKEIDIGVLSTYHEGISNSILEFMAASKPVIASGEGGTKEIILEGQTGFIIQSRRPDLLYEKIIFLLNNAKLRERLGDKGCAVVRKHFSIETMSKKYTSLFKLTVFNS